MKRIAFVLLLTGCASSGLPYPRWADVGRQWGCDPLQVQQENIEAYRGKPNRFQHVPQVGWTACDLLAKTGDPRETTMIQTESGRSFSLLFQRYYETSPHLVHISTDKDGIWRVTSVVW